jgi:hypothetical protein
MALSAWVSWLGAAAILGLSAKVNAQDLRFTAIIRRNRLEWEQGSFFDQNQQRRNDSIADWLLRLFCTNKCPHQPAHYESNKTAYKPTHLSTYYIESNSKSNKSTYE